MLNPASYWIKQKYMLKIDILNGLHTFWPKSVFGCQTAAFRQFSFSLFLLSCWRLLCTTAKSLNNKLTLVTENVIYLLQKQRLISTVTSVAIADKNIAIAGNSHHAAFYFQTILYIVKSCERFIIGLLLLNYAVCFKPWLATAPTLTSKIV